jgi:hypothetical protein
MERRRSGECGEHLREGRTMDLLKRQKRPTTEAKEGMRRRGWCWHGVRLVLSWFIRWAY